MSESFYLSVIGLGTVFVTGLCLAGCKNLYRIKCSSFSCLGMICSRDIDAENEADIQNPTATDIIPSRTFASPPFPASRRNSAEPIT